jgi:hypothetical protein
MQPGILSQICLDLPLCIHLYICQNTHSLRFCLYLPPTVSPCSSLPACSTARQSVVRLHFPPRPRHPPSVSASNVAGAVSDTESEHRLRPQLLFHRNLYGRAHWLSCSSSRCMREPGGSGRRSRGQGCRPYPNPNLNPDLNPDLNAERGRG